MPKGIEIKEFFVQKNLKKKIRFLNMKAKFNDTKVTSVATFSYVESFKQIIGLPTILEKGVTYKKAANSTFNTAEIIEYMIDANILGFSRFMHIETLRNDEGYKKFKGVDKLPSENELLNITLENGRHHSNYKFLDFFKSCVNQLPSRYLLKRVRLDRGFFDEENFLYFEDNGIEYVVKCKMYSTVKMIIDFIENSLVNHKCNELYLLIKMIAYNIHNWFKQAIMPKEVQHHEISTLRRIFYRVCGNVCGSKYYRYLSFSNNCLLEKIITHIQKQIHVFSRKMITVYT